MTIAAVCLSAQQYIYTPKQGSVPYHDTLVSFKGVKLQVTKTTKMSHGMKKLPIKFQ